MPAAERSIGELNAALAKSLEGIHAEHLGRGPANTMTVCDGDVVVAVMHNVLSKAETILARTGRHEDVAELRHLFQEEMEADFRVAVERLTGRKVTAILAGNHLDPDLAAEIFVLDAPL